MCSKCSIGASSFAISWGVEFSDRGPKPVGPNRNPETVVVKKANRTQF